MGLARNYTGIKTKKGYMLTLDNVKKIYAENDESQLFVRPSKMDIAIPHTFQIISKELALGYKVLTGGVEDSYMFVPMGIEGIKDYNAKAVALQFMKEGVTQDKGMFKSLALAVWSYMHDAPKVLELGGANIRKLLELLPSGADECLKVKFVLVKNAGTPPSYTLALKVRDDSKPELFPVKTIAKPMHLTNLYFGESPFDPPRKLEEFVFVVTPTK